MLKAQFKKYILKFKIPSGTSRGVLREKPSWFIKIFNDSDPEIFGIGECGPIEGLSRDPINIFDKKLAELCQKINHHHNVDLNEFPSIQFGLEIALKDLENKGTRTLFQNKFTKNEEDIKINGLIWMGDYAFMSKQIQEKLEKGFHCIKVKIGSLNFKDEINLLKQIRKNFKPSELELRVDANGAYTSTNISKILSELAKLDIHSIEQPIAVNQWDEMKKLCKSSPIPIALDEELINPYTKKQKEDLLRYIDPQYIVLKPSMLGGFKETEEWIGLAQKNNVGWWITSALESNIGLNAIAQFCGNFNNELPQGLGTGSLYVNNFESPLEITNQHLSLNTHRKWNFNQLVFNED